MIHFFVLAFFKLSNPKSEKAFLSNKGQTKVIATDPFALPRPISSEKKRSGESLRAASTGRSRPTSRAFHLDVVGQGKGRRLEIGTQITHVCLSAIAIHVEACG